MLGPYSMSGSETKAGTSGGVTWFEWRKPLARGAELIFIVLIDAIVFVSIVSIVKAVEKVLAYLGVDGISWTINAYALSLKEVAHYGDLAVFVAFFVVAGWHILVWIFKS